MIQKTIWEYFILRRNLDSVGNINYYKGDTREAVCAPNINESDVLNIFGQHGYELCSVEQMRSGDLKYYLKRPKS